MLDITIKRSHMLHDIYTYTGKRASPFTIRMAVDRSKTKQRAVTGGVSSGIRPLSGTTRGSPPKNPQQHLQKRPTSKPHSPPPKKPGLDIYPDTIKFLGDPEFAPISLPRYSSRRASVATTVATAAAAADAKRTAYNPSPPQVTDRQSPALIVRVSRPRTARPGKPPQYFL